MTESNGMKRNVAQHCHSHDDYEVESGEDTMFIRSFKALFLTEVFQT